MLKIYYDKDADLSLLKNKTIAIIGYGSQGHAHAQNLRDSGCNVVVGQRPGGPNYDLAKSHGIEPMSAAEAKRKETWSMSYCQMKCRETFIKARSSLTLPRARF